MLTPSIPSLPWINDVIPFALCAWCVINASLAYRTVKIAEMKCAFVLCCCRTWWISAAIHLCQYVRVKAHNLRTMSFPAFGFMAAVCDSSACIKLSQSVRGSTWLCRFDGPQDEIWSGDHLWLNAASLLHLLLRDVSLKLWPNRCVLRTLGSSSSAAASSQREILRVAPDVV